VGRKHRRHGRRECACLKKPNKRQENESCPWKTATRRHGRCSSLFRVLFAGTDRLLSRNVMTIDGVFLRRAY
jgi:hypothetical protein